MKRFSQYFLAVLFLLLIFELLVLSPNEIKENTNTTKAKSEIDLKNDESDVNKSMVGIHVIESKNENKEWELWADTAIGFKSQGNMNISKVKVNFFTPNGVSFDVVGESGSMTMPTKDMSIDGGVTTKSSNGYTFKTTTVEYSSDLRTLKSKTPVEVSGPRDGMGKYMMISGKTMKADLKEGTILIETDVRARKPVADDKMMSINSEKVQLSGSSRTVRFLGKVTIDIDGMRISGPDALFNYDRESHQLHSIDLSGGVKVSDLSKWATSDNLKINLIKNEFTFEGRPRVVQDNDELRGDKIVFLEGGKRVKVQNAKIKVSKDSLEQKPQGVTK